MHEEDQSRPSAAPPSRSSRPSRPPSPLRGAGRVAFAVGWLALQGALVLTAGRRPDGAFGFRMFGESSAIEVSLYREVTAPGGGTTRVHVDRGAWTARSRDGMLREFSWYDRVKAPRLGVFDREIDASYGARAQLARWRAALDDVAAHTKADAETRRLVLLVRLRQNGREPTTVELASAPRGGA